MEDVRQYAIAPPWFDDAATADRLWRVVVAALGPQCDELWLRFGNLGEMAGLLVSGQSEQLEALVGPHWGVPDPAARLHPPDAGADLLKSMLAGIADDLAKGFGQASHAAVQPPPRRPSPYAPYGCAVVPVTPTLIDLIVGLRAADPDQVRELPSRLADHWHFRQGARDLISTGDGMSVIGMELTGAEAETLRRAMAEAGLDPDALHMS